MTDTATIKEFLVALGFKVDESSFKKFSGGIDGATKSVAGLGLGIGAAAVATETFVTRMAASLDKIYFTSKRVGSSAGEIDDFTLAIQKMGGTAEGAHSAIESIARFRRTTPGADNILKQYGVDAKDLGNGTKAAVELAAGLRALNDVPFAYKVNDELFHFDEKTLLAMLNPDFHVGHDVADAYKALGLNQADALKGAHDFEVQLHTMMADFGAFGTWIESQLVGPLGSFNKSVLDSIKSVESLISIAQNAGMGKALEAAGIGKPTADFLSTDIPADSSAFGKFTSALSRYAGFSPAEDSDKQAIAFFESKGWTKWQAAGIVQNLQDESGLDPNVKPGDNGTAVGIGQWHPDRQARFKAHYGHDLQGSSLAEQLDFVNYELTTEGLEKSAGDRLRADLGAGSAGHDVSKYYERPLGGEASAMYRGAQSESLYRSAINAPVTINVNGGGDPKAVAGAVADAQKGVTEHLVGEMSRNFGGTQ